MPRAGALLHEFYPAGEIFDVADAVIRVFAALGDYQHKQRNRLKFLIKNLGWDRWLQEYPARWPSSGRSQARAFPFDPDDPPVEEAPSWEAATAPAARDLALRAAAAVMRGPGIRPVTPELRDDAFDRWTRTNVRRQKQDGFAIVSATIPLGDITSAQIRILADLADAYSDGTLRVTTDQNAVFRWVPSARVTDFYGRAGRGRFRTSRSRHHRGRRELPRRGVVPARGHAVTRPGAPARRPPARATPHRRCGRRGRHQDQRLPERLRPAPCGRDRLPGQHPEARARAVPQYFVMAGGGADAEGAAFGRIVAKVPARRCPEAVDRLVALYEAERQPGRRTRRVHAPRGPCRPEGGAGRSRDPDGRHGGRIRFHRSRGRQGLRARSP